MLKVSCGFSESLDLGGRLAISNWAKLHFSILHHEVELGLACIYDNHWLTCTMRKVMSPG